jgi:protein phosphatase PTC7
MPQELGRSPTFLVGTAQQRVNLDEFKRNDQHLSEDYRKNKPLCFSAKAYQRTHPTKARKEGHRDADVTLCSPVILGVADGVSQIEDFGIDSSELPRELMAACEELGMDQLLPTERGLDLSGSDYQGPVTLMREAYESTEALGSTTALLAILDNSTQIHGKLHPMIAILAIGDCELLILRRLRGRQNPLEAIFHTEMQRIGGHAQQPIQIARVDDRIDPHFDENIAIEVIERGSAAHFVSAYEGDILVMGSDGVFDNLYLDEVVAICNDLLPASSSGRYVPTNPAALQEAARRIVQACHTKTEPLSDGRYADTPIGKGGKVDDTSCVVGEAIEWTEAHCEAWTSRRRRQQWQSLFQCGMLDTCCKDTDDDSDESLQYPMQAREYPHGVNASFNERGPVYYSDGGHPEAYADTEHDKCCIL